MGSRREVESESESRDQEYERDVGQEAHRNVGRKGRYRLVKGLTIYLW